MTLAAKSLSLSMTHRLFKCQTQLLMFHLYPIVKRFNMFLWHTDLWNYDVVNVLPTLGQASDRGVRRDGPRPCSTSGRDGTRTGRGRIILGCPTEAWMYCLSCCSSTAFYVERFIAVSFVHNCYLLFDVLIKELQNVKIVKIISL